MAAENDDGFLDKAISAAALAALSASAVRAGKAQGNAPSEVEAGADERHALPNGFYDDDKAPSDLVVKIDAFQKRTPWAGFLWGVIKKFGEDKAGYLAALVAYFGFFSIFPLLIALVSALGFALEGDDELRKEISETAFDQIPIVGSTLKNTIQDVQGSGIFLFIGIAASLWAGLKVVDATQNAMNVVWNVPKSLRLTFIKRRAQGFVFLILIFVGLIGGIVVSAIASYLPDLAGSGQLAINAGTIALNMGLYTLLFKLMTDDDTLPWKAHVTGGMLAGFFWWAMQNFGVVYLSRVEESAGPTYGTFASTIVLLTFIFISAQLIILSAEVSVVRYRRLWPRALPKCDLTTADAQAWQAQAESTRKVPAQQLISKI